MYYKTRKKRGSPSKRRSKSFSRHIKTAHPSAFSGLLPPFSCSEDLRLEALLLFMFSRKIPSDIETVSESLHLPSRCNNELRALLTTLSQQQILVAYGKKKYAINHETVKEGVLSVNPRGFGFVALKTGRAGGKQPSDIFIPARNLSGALHGDRVLVFVQRFSGRSNRLTGAILATLERSVSQIVGIATVNKNRTVVTPEDEHFPFQIIIPPQFKGDAQDGNAVVVSLEKEFPGKKTSGQQEPLPVGRIIEILGNPEELAVQMEIVIRKHGLPREFSMEATAEATRMPGKAELSGDRADLRDIFHVTIDGETARDFDDAVAVLKNKAGYRLYVSIADVSHYVTPGSALDSEAYRRGTSVYFPTGVLPMLPERLSNDICSLRPHEDRCTFTCILDFDFSGKVKKTRFCKSIIQSRHRLTYTLVRKILVDRDSESRNACKSLLTPLEWMSELAALLEERRIKRGSIGLDIPETYIQLDTGERAILDIHKAERNQAHKIVEEFMLAANEAVAGTFMKHRFPALFRIHERPDPAKVMDLGRLMQSLGFQSREDAGSLRWFQQLLNTFRDTPRQYIVNNLTLRVMQQARYSDENIGHFGLAAEGYTHFTSPIRRYPDLMVHRALADLLHLEKVKRQAPEASLAEAGDFLSGRERKAVDAERDMLERLKVLYMADKVGETFEGIISGVSSFGLFVELKDSLVSGAIALADIPGHSIQIDEKNHRVIGRNAQTLYQIGDLVSVLLISVDQQRWRVNFSLSDE